MKEKIEEIQLELLKQLFKEDEFNITIKPISNGWLLKFPHPNVEGFIEEGFTYGEHWEEDKAKKAERKVLIEMLWQIVDNLCPNSKHSKYNINIELEEQEL